MPDRFGSELEEEVAAWIDEDLISKEQGDAILDRYATTDDEGDQGADWTTALLYGTAAVLVGAAALALIYVGFDLDQKKFPLLALGLALAGAGIGLALRDPDRDLLADVLMGASLAPLALAPWEADETGGAFLFALVGLGVPLAYLVWRRERPFLPTLSVLAISVASAGTAWNIFEPHATDAQVAFFWMGLQAALVIGLVAVDRRLREEDATTPVALATMVLAGSLIAFFAATLNIEDSVIIELALGGTMTGVLFAAVPLRHRGLVIGASVALGVDAIVFAFDVGGVFFGTILLIGLAILLIVQAEAVKRWVETET